MYYSYTTSVLISQQARKYGVHGSSQKSIHNYQLILNSCLFSLVLLDAALLCIVSSYVLISLKD